MLLHETVALTAQELGIEDFNHLKYPQSLQESGAALRSKAMLRHVFALWTVGLLLSAGCSSPQAKSTIRPYTAVSAPLPSAEAMPLWQTTGSLRVGVDPYFEPTRQRSVFDADFHARGILPLLVVIHNQGTCSRHRS